MPTSGESAAKPYFERLFVTVTREERSVVPVSVAMKGRASGHNALMMTEIVERLGPDLDIIVLAGKKPDAMIADPAVAGGNGNPALKLIRPQCPRGEVEEGGGGGGECRHVARAAPPHHCTGDMANGEIP
jgi:hypothetical protein